MFISFLWGFLSRGFLARGVFVLGFMSGGFCLGVFCPDNISFCWIDDNNFGNKSLIFTSRSLHFNISYFAI